MENPFKPEDRVVTKVRGKEVEAVVTAVWRNEVQVKTPDNERRQPSVQKQPSKEGGKTATALTKKRKSKRSSRKRR